MEIHSIVCSQYSVEVVVYVTVYQVKSEVILQGLPCTYHWCSNIVMIITLIIHNIQEVDIASSVKFQ